jgi:hypothetical protein
MAKIIRPASRTLTVIEGEVVGEPTQRLTGTTQQLSFDVRAQGSEVFGSRPMVATVVYELPVEGSAHPTLASRPALAALPVTGDSVLIVGVTRRRFFRTGGATVSRTEVEAHTLLVGHDRRRTRVLREALQWH